MMETIKKAPVFLLTILLSFVYLACGFLIGYIFGYSAGAEDLRSIMEGLGYR